MNLPPRQDVHSKRHAKVLIVADDLTGALDSAAPFVEAGYDATVAHEAGQIGACLASGAEIIAINTRTRDHDRPQAQRLVLEALHAVAGIEAEIVFKKIDSRLKGHPATEAGMVASHFEKSSLFIAPAVPELGRRVVDGHIEGHGQDQPLSSECLFAEIGFEKRIADARNREDMRLLAREFVERRQDMVAVGSSGLARAIVEETRGKPALAARPRLKRPFLFLLGTQDATTIEQAEQLMNQHREIGLIEAPDGRWTPPHEIAQSWVVRMMPRKLSPALSLDNLAGGLCDTVDRGFSGSLLLSGGSTVEALLARLATGPVRVVGEWEPGLPVVDLEISGRHLPLVTKSGGFGDKECLLRLHRDNMGLSRTRGSSDIWST